MDIKGDRKIIERVREFEQIVVDIFKEAEYQVSMVGTQTSYEVMSVPFDIEADKENIKYIIEVKSSKSKNKMPISMYRKTVEKLCDYSTKKGGIPVLVVGGVLTNEEREFLKDKNNIELIDISNLLYVVEGYDSIKNRLVSFLEFSVSDIVPQKCFIKISVICHSDLANNLIKELDFVKPGRGEAFAFEDICTRTLKYIFEDDLSLWKSQAKSNEALYRFDCLCRIKNNNEKDFWSILEKYFNTKYIVFEFKNYTNKITQSEIYTTERYLYAKALRSVAIIIAQGGYDNNSIWASKGCLRENGKLIILLNIDDLKKLCELKRDNEEPSEYLLDKLDTLLLELEK